MSSTRTEMRERLERAVAAAREQAGRKSHVRLLELLLAGLSAPGIQLVSSVEAGYGSEVGIEDGDSGAWFCHRLMTGDAMDLDAGHVSIDSPLGAALLGRRQGEMVDVATPGGTLSVCIARVETLPAFLDRLEREGRARPLGGRSPAGYRGGGVAAASPR